MKVVVMSATLEVEKLSEFFGHCSVLHIPGRSYPVKEIFCNLLSPRDMGSSAYVTEVWFALFSLCFLWFWGDFHQEGAQEWAAVLCSQHLCRKWGRISWCDES